MEGIKQKLKTEEDALQKSEAKSKEEKEQLSQLQKQLWVLETGFKNSWLVQEFYKRVETRDGISVFSQWLIIDIWPKPITDKRYFIGSGFYRYR